MRGNLEQLGPDRWRLRVFAGRDGTGKPHVVRRNVRGTKRQATSALAKLVADIERGRVADGHPGSVADLLERWLSEIAPQRSAYTMREHRRSVARDILPAIGALRLDKLSPRHLDDLYGALLAQGLSPASVRRRHCIVHAALDRAVRWGMIAANPADRASPPGPSRSRTSAPTVRDVQRLIAAAEQTDPLLATAIAVGAVTGARRGELCALRWSDIDWDKRTLRIERSLTVLHRVASAGPTKTHARRDVAIDEMLGVLLAHRQADQQAYARKVGVALVGDPYLLSRSADGSAPCLPDGLTAGYGRLAARLGVNGHFHQLRHFSATVAIGSGADVRTVSGRLGHADPSVTLRVYAHAIEARDRELADILGNTVLGPMHGSPELDKADPPAAPELDSAG